MTDKRDQMFPGAAGTPSDRRIVMEFESFRDFIQQVSPLVAEEGMFVDSGFLSEGLPVVGETVDFEVRLTDDFRLVHGRGQVAWVRRADTEAGAAGAAIRFQDLDEPGRRLVSRLITNHVKDGGAPFSMKAPDEGADHTAVEPEPLGPVEAEELFPGGGTLSSIEPEELDSVPRADEDPLSGAASAGGPGGLDDLPLDPAPDSLAGLDVSPRSAPIGLDETLEMPVGTGGVDVDALQPPGLETPADRSAGPAPVISGDLAQVTDELSGVHRVPPVEMPSEEDRMAIAGAASAASGHSPWRTLLFASLAGIALGVAAWYFFGEQLRDLVGLGGDELTTVAATSEAAPEPAPSPPTGDVPEADESADADPESEPDEGSGTVSVEEVAAETPTDVGSPEPSAVESAAESDTPAASPVEAAEQSAARPDPMPAAEASTLSRIEEITWSVAGGETVVTIRVDGAIDDSSYRIVRIREGAPRELIKIFGVSRPFSPKELAVGSPHVSRLRTGLHAGEIHIVADLTGPATAVTLVRAEGSRLVITFS